MQYSLTYKEHEIKFSIKVNRLAKRIILRVSQDGEVCVTIPRKGLKRQAVKMVERKAVWILTHLKKVKRDSENRLNIAEEILFLGERYPVQISENSDRLKLEFCEDKFDLYLGDAHKYEDIRGELREWYIKQARVVLPEIVREIGYENEVNRIAIRGQKTRWGSCSSQKNLNFNWRLMMAPKDVVKYVVLHELTHLEHMDHSARFWLAVRDSCPEYKRHKVWLRDNGRLLKF